MIEHLAYVDDISDIRQGDIIRRFPKDYDEQPVWGFIVTADCDIAQKKTRDRYTWLEIVRSDDFLEQFWAAEQIRRHVDKQAKIACDGLNAAIRRRNLELSEIETKTLCEWLRETTPEKILATLSQSESKLDAKLLQIMYSIRVAIGTEAPASQLDRVRSAWTRIGRDEKSQRTAIREAFDGDRGFPDFVFVPELPKTSWYGFVILLRSINSIAASDVYCSETDARINGMPDAFHRIGRFNDSLRFSVSQKLAFLFSRIGMSTQFEAACEAATDLLVEQIYKANGEKND